jgi:hypothetical protein
MAIIDMSRIKAVRAMIAMMAAEPWRADKTMAMPALERLFRRCALLTRETWLTIIFFSRTQLSSVSFSQV